MSNEYDYSGLYNHTSDGQPAQPQSSQPEQGGYPNVGSSGMNTANTARTDYSGNGASPNPQQDPNGYTSSFSGGSGNNGGYNGYSYSSAPQQPPVPQKKKPRKVLLRVLAGVGAVALGFGGGFGGAIVASRTGLTGNQVVVQQVQRSTDATAAGSTDGNSMTVQQIASVVSPSVVAITTEQMSSSQTWFGGYYVQSGAGSGVVISQDGYILTCAHVVSGATSVKVQLNGSDESYDATIVGQDSTSDIAVLKIDATGLTPAVIGDSDALAVGEVAVAVGNPLGTLSNTVTDGIVSALNRQVTVQNNDMTLIQTDASINNGNSGGALINKYGQVVGITSAKLSGNAFGSATVEGMGFAIPINTAKDIVDELIQNGYVSGRPSIGITGQNVESADGKVSGVQVYSIDSRAKAAGEGLQVGDVITAVDGTPTPDMDKVNELKQDKKAGDKLTLSVYRISTGKTLNITITLTDSHDLEGNDPNAQTQQSQSSQNDNSQQNDGYGSYGFSSPFGSFGW